MVFLIASWAISGSIKKHEELMKKLIPNYSKIKEVKSYKYFGHLAGQDLSPWGGRLEMFEFENLAALDSFFKKFRKNREASRLLDDVMALADHTTLRFSLVSEKNRELWF